MTQKLKIDIVAKDKSKQALTGVRGGLDRLKKSVFSLQGAFIGLGAGLAIRSLVNTGKQIEGLQVRLKFLFGTASEGAKAFDEMAKFAAKVPFSLEEIQAGSGVLAVVSKDAKELANLMEITGNVAAVTGLDFKTTAEQIQRSMSAGISAADLFRDRGVKSMLGFKAGAVVTVEETAAAFQKIFGKGGKFGGATDELAETFEGTLSMIGDKFFNFKRTILEAGFFEGLKKQFGDLNVVLAENSNMIEKLGVGVGTVLAVSVEKLAFAFKLVAEQADLLKEAFKIIIAFKLAKMFLNIGRAIIPVVAGMTTLVSLSVAGIPLAVGAALAGTLAYAKMGHELDKIAKQIEENHKAFKESKRVFHGGGADAATFPLAKEAEILDTFLRTYENELGIKIPSATEKAISKFREMNDGVLEDIKRKKENIRMIIAEGINNGITNMSKALSRSLVFGEKLSDTLRNMARNVLSKIIAHLIEQIARQAISIAMENTQIGQLMTKLGIEKMITHEKTKQSVMKGVSTGGDLLTGIMGSFASGGAVSKGQPILVGENGAEVFVPNQTGQITQSARGGSGGGSTTVNFNINTVDARGFDELLTQSRGTITQLINQAVNERGAKSII